MNSLADAVIAELQRRKGEWRAIAEAIQVSYSWIEKLARGEIQNPGIRTIERLHDHLFGPAGRAEA